MPPPDAIQEPVINVGPFGKAAWRQAGTTFGRTETGYFEQVPFEGTENEVRALAAAYNAAGALWEVTTLTGRRARLQVRLGTTSGGSTEIPEDVWELDAQEIQKDLLEADFPFSDLDAVIKTEKEIIRRAINDKIPPKAASIRLQAEADAAGTGEVYDTFSAAAMTLYRHMLAGMSYFPVEASIIRHNRAVSNVWQAQASFLNVGRILSNNAMLTLEDSGDLFLFSLPTIPTATQFIETAGDLQYGWRKIRPRITRLTYNKWQISNTYQFGLWATSICGAVL